MCNVWKICKSAGLWLAFALALLGVIRPANASVSTSAGDSGDADTVYIAGNPDAYPLEYYNADKEAFCGVFPDVLNAVSEKTGISFTYIYASGRNQQKELARNNQVELVTALPAAQNEVAVEEFLPVLEITTRGQKTVYGIGFTGIASPELAAEMETALSEISDAEKMGYLLAASNKNPEVTSKSRLIKIVLLTSAAVFAAILGGFAVLYHKRKKLSREELQIDAATGIGNGKYYEYAFEQLLSRQSRNLYAVIYLACDEEALRGECGEKTADEIERYAAAHLNAKIASAEYLARISSGVFALLIQAPSETECAARARAIADGLNGYIREFYPNIESRFTAGVSRLCAHPDCNAETALYNAKQGYLAARRNGESAEITAESDLAQSKKREKLRSSIANAVSEGEFRVYLQFIHENSSGKICGAEALSRWQNKDYGMLHPHEYLDILKSSGQIIAHDYRMFSLVCHQLEVWSGSPYDRLFLTCNFTRTSFCQNDFFDRISEIASGYQFLRSRLVIEIIEDSIAENAKIFSENIRKCREAGFKIAIDDMGAGFSSFADLYDNEIDFVKIDGAFISSCTSERQQVMLSNVIRFVHQAGAKALCEGVETLKQAEFLSQIGCDMMQGFYFSKILPLVECGKFLKNENIAGASDC